ncbi:MAG TPA: hypothetical protein VEL31_26005 [Ktedonobacteraceae bacterium]|nr:hypothetical protein [Ktedonobacteraceae bacterium]
MMKDQEPSKLSRIQDIPRIKSLVDQVRLFKLSKQAFPLVKPVLKLLGIATEQIEAALAEVDVLEKQVTLLATLPDRFNRLFASRGWIAYDLFNVDVAQAAVEKAEAGDIDGAEADLVDYYNEEHIRWHLRTMQAIPAFHPRLSLLEKALDDYLQGRYHASVPVVLMQLDGFVSDVGKNHSGFFREGVNLEAWDSIAAHSTGLQVLAKLLGKERLKTTTEPVTLPYRHGILHGHDLGYDNKLVAAKAWAAIFAVREWAYTVEQKEEEVPAKQPAPTWRDLVRTLQENANLQTQLKAWRPRSVQIGVDIPTSGDPEAYEYGSPEQKLAEYLSFWRKRNYGKMAQCLALSTLKFQTSINALAGELREYYELRALKSFTLLEVHDFAPAGTTISVKIQCEDDGEDREHTIEYRLLFESETGKPVIRGDPEGRWWVFSPYYV